MMFGLKYVVEFDVTIASIESRQLVLRSEMLNIIREFAEEEIQGLHGRRKLVDALAIAMWQKLMLL